MTRLCVRGSNRGAKMLVCMQGFVMCLCEFRDACAKPLHFGIIGIDIDFAAMQIGELGLISSWHSKFFCDQRMRFFSLSLLKIMSWGTQVCKYVLVMCEMPRNPGGKPNKPSLEPQTLANFWLQHLPTSGVAVFAVHLISGLTVSKTWLVLQDGFFTAAGTFRRLYRPKRPDQRTKLNSCILLLCARQREQSQKRSTFRARQQFTHVLFFCFFFKAQSDRVLFAAVETKDTIRIF